MLAAQHVATIELAKYNHEYPLVIDPSLAYSTYIGGNVYDLDTGLAVDSAGNTYLAGQTFSTTFPTINGYSSVGSGNGKGYVTKLDPAGTTVLYSTYVGGSGSDDAARVAIDGNGGVYTTGFTTSADFPVVNGFQTALGGGYGNAFVMRLDTTQSGASSLVYSSFIGGGGNSTSSAGDTGFAIATDGNGLAYITGQATSDASTTPFPTTSNAFQSTLGSEYGNAFLTVVDTNQSGAGSLLYSTYLGGLSTGFGDYGMGIAVDNSGDAFITGQTTSDWPNPFPTTSNAYQTNLNSEYGNAYVAEIATTQSGYASLIYSTYLGGSGDSSSQLGDGGQAIAIDSTGKAYITGRANSLDFPTTAGAYQVSNSAEGKAFVAKLDPQQQSSYQSLVYSSYLGGSDGELGTALLVDSTGVAYLTGGTLSPDYPVTSDAYQSTKSNGSANGFLTLINPAGTALNYSTFLGGNCSDGGQGVALDWNGNIYVAGDTCSTDFPTSTSAYQTSLNGSESLFVTKFAFNANPGITASESPQPNPNGWNNSPITVSFACIPGAAPLSSCTSPDNVGTEGANQRVTGTAEDTASNTATATATVNIDLTPPSLSIVNPANNAIVSTPYVAISGTISDALSGVAGVTCNGATASVSGTSFSCTVPLNSVSNSIAVVGFDVAGNATTSTLNITVSMGAPTLVTVTPPNPTMTIGGAQAFTAVDQTGAPRPDATWSISDTTIASFESNSPNTLVGNAAGTATVTATVGTVTGQTTVTVLSGSPSIGTVLWSTPAASGFSTQQIVQAVPTQNGPDLFALDEDSSGDMQVRALTSDGRQLWKQALSSSHFTAFTSLVGDNNGGVLALDQGSGYITDLSPLTGATNWLYSAPSSFEGSPAIAPDGSIYIVQYAETDGSPNTLDVIDGAAGTLVRQIALRTSSFTETTSVLPWDCAHQQLDPVTSYGREGPIMVGPDGSVYLQVEGSQNTRTADWSPDGSACTTTNTANETLSLMTVPPGGGSQLQQLASYSQTDSFEDVPPPPYIYPSHAPGNVIPDGNSGVLATWTDDPGGTNFSRTISLTLADVAQGAVETATVPSSEPQNALLPNSMVLGDNGVAFLTDTKDLVAFDTPSLQQDWTYTSTGGSLALLASSNGSRVTINDSQEGVVELGSSGNPTQVLAQTLSSAQFSWSNHWFDIASDPEPQEIALPIIAAGSSIWSAPSGSSGNRASYALNPVLLQMSSVVGSQPTCPFCALQAPTCTTLSGTGTTYLMLIGDQGINTTNGNHDVGSLFKLAAQTEANNLQAQSHRVIACRISTVQEMNTALTTHGLIDGGVMYFGHAGDISYSGSPALYSALFLGQDPGFYTNVTAQNVTLLSNSELASGSTITLYGCTTAAHTPDGNPAIARILAQQLQRTVVGYAQFMHFSNLDATHDTTINGPKTNPSGLPIYMNPDGAPPRPNPIYFYPRP